MKKITYLLFFNFLLFFNLAESNYYKHLPNELESLILENLINYKIKDLIKKNDITNLVINLAKSLSTLRLVNKRFNNNVKYYIKNYLNKNLLSFNIDIKFIYQNYLNYLTFYLNLNLNKKFKYMLKFLIDTGLDINIKNYYGENILIYAIKTKNNNLVKFILNYKLANINKSQSLIEAVKTNDIEIIKDLIKSKVDINEKNTCGNTPLMISAENKNIDQNIVKLLIKNGADINQKNNKNETVLTTAIKYNNKKIIQLLIKSKANINGLDYYGRSPLKIANLFGNKDIINLLKKFGAEEYPKLRTVGLTR